MKIMKRMKKNCPLAALFPNFMTFKPFMVNTLWAHGRFLGIRRSDLVDGVFGDVPVRQWVLTLPHRLRYKLAYDHPLCRAVLAVFVRALLAFERRRAREAAWFRRAMTTIPIAKPNMCRRQATPEERPRRVDNAR